jgi:hypothetical protein
MSRDEDREVELWTHCLARLCLVVAYDVGGGDRS